MTGIEVAVGYMIAWAVRKAKRVAGRADAEADRTLDAAMDRLHALISGKLGEDPALRMLTEEAGTGRTALSGETGQRVRLALDNAAQQDPGFAEALDRAVRELQAVSRASGAVSAGDGGQAAGANVHIEADRGSAAAWNMGNVTLGNPPQPGPHRG
jgi:hypothetical protein